MDTHLKYNHTLNDLLYIDLSKIPMPPFDALYFKEKLKTVNNDGRIAIVTLWSKTSYVFDLLEREKIDLSDVAVIGNLYGNGLRHMLRNLLYNPQISRLIIFGQDLSGSREELKTFFAEGTEDFEENGMTYRRVKGTNRILDTEINRELFPYPLDIVDCGAPKDEDSLEKLKNALVKPLQKADESLPRQDILLPKVEATVSPSNPAGHIIIEENPLDAWRELVFRLYKFGLPVELKKGKRKELLNVKVVVNKPHEESDEKLQKYGLNLDKFKRYQEGILSSDIPEDIAYRYGNRIRAYFNVDFLDAAIERLKKDIQDRHSYFSLWDSSKDVLKGLRKEGSASAPCLVSLFFRYFGDKLCMTACFRTHNGMDAWLENFYGLMALQRYVAKGVGLSEEMIGSITVVSHSISLNMDDFERGEKIALGKSFQFKQDPNGQFLVTTDDNEIVVVHTNDQGIVLNEYRSKKAEKIQHDLYRDGAISDVNHAMYVGRELTLAELALKK